MKKLALSLAMLVLIASQGMAQELTTNGDFETGDTSGWDPFLPALSTFDVTNDSASGTWAGLIENTNDAGAGAVVKQANIGIGTVMAGDTIEISFDAKGSGANGGVAFAEFFSEISGGGTSSSEILGGAPLALTNDYQTFNFTAVAGADVTGGVSLQFNAATGAVTGSTSTLFVDNVSVSVQAIPEPTSFAVLGLAGLGLLSRRRR